MGREGLHPILLARLHKAGSRLGEGWREVRQLSCTRIIWYE